MDKIVQAAAELLLKCGKVSLPMDAGAVAKGVGYYVDRQSNGAEVLEQKNLDLDHLPDGLSIVNNGRYCIYYSDGLSAEKKNKVIAHEIGHIVLHLDWSSPYYLGPVDMDDPEDNGKAEAEADRFALHLIAPLSALYTAGLRAPDEIREVLGFSDDDCKLLAFELLQYAEEQKGQKLQRKAQKKMQRD